MKNVELMALHYGKKKKKKKRTGAKKYEDAKKGEGVLVDPSCTNEGQNVPVGNTNLEQCNTAAESEEVSVIALSTRTCGECIT